jgi:ubiquinone/menaquinone biosynthesis C-methylase UbiE
MTLKDEDFVGSIPEIYDRLFVPLIFEVYADDLARRIGAYAPRRVLETAAGTGVLTRALARHLPAEAKITATDLNQPMLDRARARSGSDGRIGWRQADALALPFGDREFDVVTCQFGAMFFPDKVKGYAEARRVLKPEGRFAFNVWGRIADNELADVITQALAELFPDDPPRFMARTPHGYCDPDRIRAELAAAGFRDIAIEPVERQSTAPDARTPALAYCQGSPLRSEIEARKGDLEEATRHAEGALRQRFGPGPITSRIKALVITAAA